MIPLGIKKTIDNFNTILILETLASLSHSIEWVNGSDVMLQLLNFREQLHKSSQSPQASTDESDTYSKPTSLV